MLDWDSGPKWWNPVLCQERSEAIAISKCGRRAEGAWAASLIGSCDTPTFLSSRHDVGNDVLSATMDCISDEGTFCPSRANAVFLQSLNIVIPKSLNPVTLKSHNHHRADILYPK
jgi:hypothetical protein